MKEKQNDTLIPIRKVLKEEREKIQSPLIPFFFINTRFGVNMRNEIGIKSDAWCEKWVGEGRRKCQIIHLNKSF